MARRRASVTEAKNGLSALIDRVRRGDSIIIEDRGIPVARLESMAGRRMDGRLERLEREGLVRRPSAHHPADLLSTPPPSLGTSSSLSDAIIDERRHGR